MKRFRDTKISREAWYRKLKPVFKCTWDFLCDECDEAGMWSIDLDALFFFLGEEINFNEFLLAVNADKYDNPRVELYGKDKVWITGFVEFQCGELSEKCIPHKKIITLLIKYELIDRVPARVSGRVQGTLNTRKDKNGMERKGIEKTLGECENPLPETPPEPERRQKGKREPNLQPEVDQQKALKTQYIETVALVQAMPETRDQKIALMKFITDHKPKFIEPYCDLWNISVKTYGISAVKSISDGRLSKFKTRIREPDFDFVQILSEIKQSDYLQGKTNGWRVDWDWIFENDTNYLRIIEGKYRNQSN